MKRPGNGITPMNISLVLNNKLNKNVHKDYKLSLKDIVKN